jgi:hypothetical protein
VTGDVLEVGQGKEGRGRLVGVKGSKANYACETGRMMRAVLVVLKVMDYQG